jgi:hypothetical protein
MHYLKDIQPLPSRLIQERSMNNRCPVSVPPFPVYLFSETLNVIILNLIASSLVNACTIQPPSSTTSRCTTAATTLILKVVFRALICFTNFTILVLLLITESTKIKVIISSKNSGLRSSGSLACGNRAWGNVSLIPTAIGSPMRMSGMMIVLSS